MTQSNHFYFNIMNGDTDLDPDGTQLSGIAEARRQALEMLGAMHCRAAAHVPVLGGSAPWPTLLAQAYHCSA
jgi:hypothetical protein